MVNNPLVTVIVPVFNSEEFLEKSLMSVWQQNYRPIELLIVDDESTDLSIEISSNFKTKNDSESFNVKLLRNIKKGAPSARNYGLSLSNGKYIQFLDSDDILLPNKIESGVKFLSANDSEIVYSKAQFIDRDGNLIKSFWGRPLQNDSSDYFEFPWQTMCALYTKGIIERIGYWNEELTINQDWEFALKFVISNCKIIFIDKVQSYYRTGATDNIGSNLSMDKIYSKEVSTRNIYLLIKESKKLDAYLKNKFTKRFIYVIIEYGKLGEWNKINNLNSFLKMEGLSNIFTNTLSLIKIDSIFNSISNIYRSTN